MVQEKYRVTVVRWTSAVVIVAFGFGLSSGRAAHGQGFESFLTTRDQQAANVYERLQQNAFGFLEQRVEKIKELKTPAMITKYQKLHRAFLIEQLGGLPERGALNAKTVGVIQAVGYRIEKVIFESQPNHHVTANLYLPDQASEESPVPGIAVSSGHSRTAKTADYNQRFGIMFARHGMAAICFDPIGQGERSQILDDEGEPLFVGTTTEHMLIGVGSTLVGRNTASYRIWDGMRAVDYLCSRPEINSSKIGYTGCSGGGTLTSYVMALDDRIRCAAPACYLTNFRRLIETIGPQDAEQNIFSQIAFGLDHPDYVIMRAPKPTLISATSNDFFDINGSWETFRQSKMVYGRLGLPENVDLVEIEGNHGVQPQNLATITHWMRRWLMDIDQPVEAVEITARPADDLICTATGQVLTSFEDELSIADLNRQHEQRLAQSRSDFWSGATAEQKRGVVREVLRIEEGASSAIEYHDRGVVSTEVGSVECGVLELEGRSIPIGQVHPDRPSGQWCIVLHDQGLVGGLNERVETAALVKKGYSVLLVDLAGQGFTSTRENDPVLTDWKTFYLAYLLGQSMVELQVKDLIAVAKSVNLLRPTDSPANTNNAKLSSETQVNQKVRGIELFASGQSAIVAIHAAALMSEQFSSIHLSNTPDSWASVTQLSAPDGCLSSAIHGVLRHYDWPDLIELAGEGRVDQK